MRLPVHIVKYPPGHILRHIQELGEVTPAGQKNVPAAVHDKQIPLQSQTVSDAVKYPKQLSLPVRLADSVKAAGLRSHFLHALLIAGQHIVQQSCHIPVVLNIAAPFPVEQHGHEKHAAYHGKYDRRDNGVGDKHALQLVAEIPFLLHWLPTSPDMPPSSSSTLL